MKAILKYFPLPLPRHLGQDHSFFGVELSGLPVAIRWSMRNGSWRADMKLATCSTQRTSQHGQYPGACHLAQSTGKAIHATWYRSSTHRHGSTKSHKVLWSKCSVTRLHSSSWYPSIKELVKYHSWEMFYWPAATRLKLNWEQSRPDRKLKQLSVSPTLPRLSAREGHTNSWDNFILASMKISFEST